MAYATESDLYEYGLARGSVPNPGRRVESVDVAANSLVVGEHGLAANQPLTLRAAAAGSLPAPLVAETTYYADPISDNAFRVRSVADGAAIDLTTTGSLVHLILPLPIDAALEFGAQIIDDLLPEHAVPLTAPYPQIVVITNAELAAWKLTAMRGAVSKSLGEMVDEARKRLARWARHVPLRDSSQTPTGLAATAGSGVSPWRRWGGFC